MSRTATSATRRFSFDMVSPGKWFGSGGRGPGARASILRQPKKVRSATSRASCRLTGGFPPVQGTDANGVQAKNQNSLRRRQRCAPRPGRRKKRARPRSRPDPSSCCDEDRFALSASPRPAPCHPDHGCRGRARLSARRAVQERSGVRMAGRDIAARRHHVVHAVRSSAQRAAAWRRTGSGSPTARPRAHCCPRPKSRQLCPHAMPGVQPGFRANALIRRANPSRCQSAFSRGFEPGPET